MFKNLDFESERLITQKLTGGDVEVLYKIYSDGKAMKYRGNRPMKSADDAVRMVDEQSLDEVGTYRTRLGIRRKSDNILVGTLLLVAEKNDSQKLEIGFSFGQDHWGNGFGQETLNMIESKLSAQNGFIELRAWCVKANGASVRIFRKSGYSELPQVDYPQSILFTKLMKHDVRE